MEHGNKLSTEKSPYLLQHKDNPVWWHPWGEEAFARARAEDKPVFLSIGYSTCYWCHVMEKDSFESADVARVLNENFVSIKVDREELPDVDQIYMEVVMGIHGHGGWPMSVFLTPEREPFWGGTFFYKDNFVGILSAMADAWRNDRQKVLTSSGELTRFLRAKRPNPSGQPLDASIFGLGMQQLFKRYDKEFGGFGEAPKFPPTQPLAFLMRAHACKPNAAALEVTSKTLSAMARGGLFDQLGGGFHRYSVDAEWRIPHFEKMLYDNALLAPLYGEAYRVTGNEMFKVIADRTLLYLVDQMMAPSGGFYSAEDAGEVDREGEFYSWSYDEVSDLLGEEQGGRFCSLFGISREGNFEHGRSVPMILEESRWAESESEEVAISRRALLARRAARVHPHRDEKIITGWNGLALTALCRGFQLLGVSRYLNAALQTANFLENTVRAGGLKRRVCQGEVGVDAVLEDYAYLIEGYIALAEASGDGVWWERAAALQREQDARLWSAEHRGYLSSTSPGLIVQLCEWVDGATPSPNGVSMNNLRTLSEVLGDSAFASRAMELELGAPTEVFGLPMVYMSTLRGGLLRLVGPSTCGVVTPAQEEDPPAEVRQLWARYLPFTTVLWHKKGGAQAKMLESRPPLGDKPTMYVCRRSSCCEPTLDVETAVRVCSQTSLFVDS
jgi:uncharacterized protein YyaL (SSP411 family)